MKAKTTAPKKQTSFIGGWKKEFRRNYDLYIMSLPALIAIIIFAYVPMYGVQIAFKDFMASLGITGSPWVGFEHFTRLFNGYSFTRIVKNTLTLSVYTLVAGTPLPVILAIMLNELRFTKAKKVFQMVSYAPHFISTVVVVAMINVFFDRSTGLINILFENIGLNKVGFLTEPSMFKHIYVWSDIWQTLGWNTVIYSSVLASIDPQLYDAASVDGATKLQRIIHVDIPGILPTAIILLIMNAGRVMSVGFDKTFLMQNPLNLETSEIISTYVYDMGIQGAEYSFSTAVGLFNSVINLILLVTVNKISSKVSESSLW